jgi:hypothetical protein
MKVGVAHGLMSVAAVVHDHPEAGVAIPCLDGSSTSHEKDPP